jgi:hypothetical protein
MSIYAKIENGDYDTKLPYPSYEDVKSKKISKEEDREMRRKWKIDRNRLVEVFKHDSLEELGILNHPKADKLFDIAWEEGHSNGLTEVWLWMETLADLLN